MASCHARGRKGIALDSPTHPRRMLSRCARKANRGSEVSQTRQVLPRAWQQVSQPRQVYRMAQVSRI